MVKIEKLKSFLEREIWQMDLGKVKGSRHFVIKIVRTFIIAWRDFKKDNCQLKASALTFYTLLSIVPVIAMFFGIAKGFGFEKKLEEQFKTDISYNQEVIAYVFNFANSMLENTKGGLIAGFGVLILFWTIMKVLGNIEASFNDIWEIKISRSWVRKFSDYMSVILIAPVLIILASSIQVFIQTQISTSSLLIESLGIFGPLIYFLLGLMPFVLTTVLFTMIYIILPNTKVTFSSAFFGAIFGAALFLIVEWLYLTFQVGVSKYNAIYGGFAALPLFLAWVQTNWLVVLLGAEISFAFQNQGKYEFEIESIEISASYRYILSIAVLRAMIKRFETGEKGITTSEISESMHIPAKLVRRIVNDLVECSVVVETKDDDRGISRFIPAIDIARLDLNYVLRKLNDHGINEIPVEKSEYLLKIEEAVKKSQDQMAVSKQNLLIKDL